MMPNGHASGAREDGRARRDSEASVDSGGEGEGRAGRESGSFRCRLRTRVRPAALGITLP